MKLFISRNESSLGQLTKDISSKGVKLCAQSLIAFEPIPFNLNQDYDWVFFGSRNGVKYFLSQSDIKVDAKVACVGQKTADYLLENHQIKSHFIGEGTDTTTIGESFRKVSNGKILFPQSNISLQSIQKKLEDSEIVDLLCYKTRFTSNKIDKQDIYFFTSPSNIDSYLEQNQIDPNAKYFCLGSSTEQKLTFLNVFSIQTIPSISDILKFI